MSDLRRVSTTSTGQEADGASYLAYSYNQNSSSAVFSADGNSIVFESSAPDIVGNGGTSSIVLKNLATGADTIVSGGTSDAQNATFSPDGSKVVFQAYDGTANRIYETNLATSQVALVGTATNASTLGVSTTGDKIEYATDASNTGGAALSVATVSTGKTLQIGDGSANSIYSVGATKDLHEVLYASIPPYSGSGSYTGTSQLYAENTNTGARVLVSGDGAGNAGDMGAYYGYLTPSGNQVVFSTSSTNLAAGATSGGILTKDIGTGAVTVVVANAYTTTNANNGDGSGLFNSLQGLSADGAKILYVAENGSQTTTSDGTTSGNDSTQIKIKTLATGAVANASPVYSETYSYSNSSTGSQGSSNGTEVRQVVFSPDATKVAYVTQNASNYKYSYVFSSDGSTTPTQSGTLTSQISIFDVSTGKTTAIYASLAMTAPVYIENIAFSPDGSKLAYSAYDSGANAPATTVYDLATGANYTVPADNSSIFFSPDGKSVAFASSNSTLVPNDKNDSSDVFIEPVCFVTGTRIRTLRGDVAVEALAVGEKVVTASGEARPIVWIGSRTIACGAHPDPAVALPIRVAPGAFGQGRPERETWLSPGHAVCVNVLDEILVPVGLLVNGGTIAQVAMDSVTYWHVELESHDILLADGLPAESYIDVGNRGFFSGASCDPDAIAHVGAYCRPFVTDQAIVSTLRARLQARALAIGWACDDSPDLGLHLEVDGAVVAGSEEGAWVGFQVPAGAAHVALVSHTFVPAHLDGIPDPRTLGVQVRAITLDDGLGTRAIDLGDPSLHEGFHDPETHGALTWRWTDGRAVLPASLWRACGGPVVLRVEIGNTTMRRWIAPSAARDVLPDRADRLVA